jgi:hypothetical protein
MLFRRSRPPALRVALASAALLAACALPAPPPVGVMDLSARPAERALLAGLKAYDDAQYESAERLFREALAAGLASPRDRGEAHKRLAFLHCAAGRLADCEAEFRLARQADRNFALDKSEAGHPVWGPVYKKLQP